MPNTTLIAESELFKLIEESDLPKITAALDTQQISIALLKACINRSIQLANNAALNLFLDSDKAKELDQWQDLLASAIHNELEASVIVKMLGICIAKLSGKECLNLLEAISYQKKDMTSVVAMLLPNIKVYETMLMERQTGAPPLFTKDAPPNAFCKAVESGNVTIVKLLLPYIIKIGDYSEEGYGYSFESLMRTAKEKVFSDIVDLLLSIPQVQKLELASKVHSQILENEDMAWLKGTIEAGFDDTYVLSIALGKAIEKDDYPMFEYLISIPALSEYVIMMANRQATSGDRWDYRFIQNRIDTAAKYHRSKMLNRFIDIDSSAVSNSRALYSAVGGKSYGLPEGSDKFDQVMFDLLLARTKFVASRNMMYTIQILLNKGDHKTIDKIFAKVSYDARNQDEVNTFMQETVRELIADSGYSEVRGEKLLPIFQLPVVKTALDADKDCTVLIWLMRAVRWQDVALVKRMFDEYLGSGKIKEVQNARQVLWTAIFEPSLVWMIDTLLTIPEVIEALKTNPEPFIKQAIKLKDDQLEHNKRTPKHADPNRANAYEHIQHQLQAAVAVQVKEAKRMRGPKF